MIIHYLNVKVTHYRVKPKHMEDINKKKWHCPMLDFLVKFGGHSFQQIIVISLRTNRTPCPAVLFAYSFDEIFIQWPLTN